MPVFEAGLWVMLIVLASFFTFASMKTLGQARAGFTMLAMALWAGLSIISAAGYEIAATESATDGVNTWEFTRTIIPGGETASWLSYLFIGFALFNIFNAFKEVVIKR